MRPKGHNCTCTGSEDLNQTTSWSGLSPVSMHCLTPQSDTMTPATVKSLFKSVISDDIYSTLYITNTWQTFKSTAQASFQLKKPALTLQIIKLIYIYITFHITNL